MQQRNFEEWLTTFRNSIMTYDYYVNFKKVYENVDEIKIQLNILNSLIGDKNIRHNFDAIVREYPKVKNVIPLLLAIRENELHILEEDKTYDFIFTEDMSNEKLKYFMEKVGLFDLLENHIISNLVDYAIGVEVGLDANGRKNRGGHLMENLVEKYIQNEGFVLGKNYFKEMYIRDVEKAFNLNLSSLSNNGTSKKRFDFIVKTDTCVYAIETNFYLASGSKLNETARSYKMLALEAKNIKKFKFVWITDGSGWLNAKNNLRETFDVLDELYNINDLKNGILESVFV